MTGSTDEPDLGAATVFPADGGWPRSANDPRFFQFDELPDNPRWSAAEVAPDWLAAQPADGIENKDSPAMVVDVFERFLATHTEWGAADEIGLRHAVEAAVELIERAYPIPDKET